MDKPRLLDLFCGAGGATRGYQQAGFYVVGVDIAPQPRYVGDEFHQADALTFPLHGFDAIHAGPTCQDYSTGNTWLPAGRTRKQHPRLIQPVRERLMRSGSVWVIENVRLALKDMLNPLLICGTSLGLRVQRHRLFDSNAVLFAAGPHKHQRGDVSVRTCRAEYLRMGEGPVRINKRGEPYQRNKGCGVEGARAAMGIDWMTMHELGEAIPPAYTEWIGRQLMSAIDATSAVA